MVRAHDAGCPCPGTDDHRAQFSRGLRSGHLFRYFACACTLDRRHHRGIVCSKTSGSAEGSQCRFSPWTTASALVQIGVLYPYPAFCRTLASPIPHNVRLITTLRLVRQIPLHPHAEEPPIAYHLRSSLCRHSVIRYPVLLLTYPVSFSHFFRTLQLGNPLKLPKPRHLTGRLVMIFVASA